MPPTGAGTAPTEWAGAAALPEFRRERLLRAARERVPGLHSLDAAWLYYLDVEGALSPQDEAVLRALLDEGEPPAAPSDGHRLFVLPRLGTISPWSSKATDIVHACGVASVRRVERGLVYTLQADGPLDAAALDALAPLLHDRMTQTLLARPPGAEELFGRREPGALARVPLLAEGAPALRRADRDLGLALSDDEIEYLAARFLELGRDPTDVELMMFAQANSEHCRHKIFNARWIIDGVPRPMSLFDYIRSTHATNPAGVLSAYRDNAAVIEGAATPHLLVNPETGRYEAPEHAVHTLMKVETHNHPTAISPFPGAATGAGGEIRDEGATGRGGRPKAGLTGFSVSHLRVPGWPQPWESPASSPARIATPLEIMIEGPIGAAAFNNEFGRPAIAGYFRTFEQRDDSGTVRGYHKPIMLAGGLGNVLGDDVAKAEVPPGALLIVLGGPAMLIGLGGGAASSVGSGSSAAELDYASVQRGNPEMQRRAQQVIEACRARGAFGGGNPVLLIHDVGAGGLSNAVPEVVDHSRRGAEVQLREVPSADPGMSPLEIWCNEAQERYVLAISPDDLDWFGSVCARERCPWAVIGRLDDSRVLRVEDALSGERPVDMPLEVLLGKPPKTVRDIARTPAPAPAGGLAVPDLAEACRRVLRLPAVADKSFLIHIGDRTVGGLVARDQLVGPWQVPVSDVAVTSLGFDTVRGEAMAIGERSPLALLDAPASGRMAVAEALTNIAAADIPELALVRLSANWMAASGWPGEDERLHDTVAAVAAFCRELKIAIPVGKDSLSMQTRWQEEAAERAVVAPVSLVVSAFAPVGDVDRTATPQLVTDRPTRLVLLDLGEGRDRLGGSALAQVWDQSAGEAPDLADPGLLARFFAAIQGLREDGLLLAYHDRSDGGLFVTLAEMAFAGHAALDVDLGEMSPERAMAALFSEEAGAVLQVEGPALAKVEARLRRHGLGHCSRVVGRAERGDRIRIRAGDALLLDEERSALHRTWSELSCRMQALRDDPECAREAWEAATDPADPGLSPVVAFGPEKAPAFTGRAKPRVAVLREQGVNSQLEMAAAFMRAGFDVTDVHMTDILSGRTGLAGFAGLAVCGGFSYGDVLGAGGGWARSILFNARARDEFAAFFALPHTFALGVCNGCQMMAALTEIVPGAEGWPRFRVNRSRQFEARLSLVEVPPSRSVLLAGMEGSRLLIASSHGEGRAEFPPGEGADTHLARGTLALRYVDNSGQPTERYPANPNGSPGGVAGLCSADGRVTVLMPHPERVHLSRQHSWRPADWGEEGPWMRLFRNARRFVG